MDENQITESAKAAQEFAKTTGKAVDGVREFGGFISKYIAGSLEQGMGIFEDKLKYMRWERQLRLIQRARQIQIDAGINEPTKAIPIKLAIPLLEAASLEDDDYLQDLWARLLVNSSNAESGIDLQRSYISVLEQITPLEASILEKIYSLPYQETRHNGIEVGMLPAYVSIGKDEATDAHLSEPPEDIKLALANLSRVGCISIQKSWGGGELFKKVNPTLLGKSFVEACTINTSIGKPSQE